jgi:curved DNA-binding protein CbpA
MPDEYEKYFRILDLDVGASKEGVKKAFRELSHIWHPDNHMGKPSNVQNRATEKFKEISNAYQVLNGYLSAEEKKKAEQDQRERAEKEQKQQKENERRKKEEESRRKAEQVRRDREEKERKYWEEQAKKKQEEEKEREYWEEQVKKKHKEEKSKQRKKEYIFVSCPKCKKNIIANTTENLSKTCESCGHVYYYYFEDGELKVVSYSKEDRRRKEQAYGKERANNLHKEEQKKTETIDTADYKWGWEWIFIIIFLFPALILFVLIFTAVIL